MNGLNAFFSGKCPHCRTGKVFKYSFYNVRKFKEMHETCPHCKVKFEQEPGFFWGAMYFSYALNVALMITTGVAYYTLSPWDSDGPFMILLITLTVLFMPITFRASRLLMMYIAAPYRRYRGKDVKEEA